MPLACRRGTEDGKVLFKAQTTANTPQSHMTKYSANPRGVKALHAPQTRREMKNAKITAAIVTPAASLMPHDSRTSRFLRGRRSDYCCLRGNFRNVIRAVYLPPSLLILALLTVGFHLSFEVTILLCLDQS